MKTTDLIAAIKAERERSKRYRKTEKGKACAKARQDALKKARVLLREMEGGK